MTKTIAALFFVCFLQPAANAQTSVVKANIAPITQLKPASVAALIDHVKAAYASDTARAEAIYLWITHNISYDLERLKARDNEPNGKPQPVDDVLQTRAAVCQGYADLFVALCKGTGIDAEVVPGYTKNRGVVSPIAHAWAAAKLQNNWYLFDPTWGAGYVANDRFVPAFNKKFYKVLPVQMIDDHMPFDPMYQFLERTVTNQAFMEGQTSGNKNAPVFNFSDTLEQWRLLSTVEKMESELRRLEQNGIRNGLVAKRQAFLKKNLQSYQSRDAFMEAGEAFQQANRLFNIYINQKNAGFSGLDDRALRQSIDSIRYYTKRSRSLLLEAIPKTEEQRQAKTANGLNIERFGARVQKEVEFVEKFLATANDQRQSLFRAR